MSVLDRADRVTDRAKERLTDSRAREVAERLDENLDVEGQPAQRAAEALEDKLRPATYRARAKLDEARDEIGDQAPQYAKRVREAGSEYAERLRENAPEYAERLADSGREALDRVTDFVDDLDERQVRRWGPRIGAAAVGFVVGFLVGWLVARRDDEDDDPYRYGAVEHRGSAGTTPTSEAKPSTPMPRSSAASGDGDN